MEKKSAIRELEDFLGETMQYKRFSDVQNDPVEAAEATSSISESETCEDEDNCKDEEIKEMIEMLSAMFFDEEKDKDEREKLNCGSPSPASSSKNRQETVRKALEMLNRVCREKTKKEEEATNEEGSESDDNQCFVCDPCSWQTKEPSFEEFMKHCMTKSHQQQIKKRFQPNSNETQDQVCEPGQMNHQNNEAKPLKRKNFRKNRHEHNQWNSSMEKLFEEFINYYTSQKKNEIGKDMNYDVPFQKSNNHVWFQRKTQRYQQNFNRKQNLEPNQPQQPSNRQQRRNQNFDQNQSQQQNIREQSSNQYFEPNQPRKQNNRQQRRNQYFEPNQPRKQNNRQQRRNQNFDQNQSQQQNIREQRSNQYFEPNQPQKQNNRQQKRNQYSEPNQLRKQNNRQQRRNQSFEQNQSEQKKLVLHTGDPMWKTNSYQTNLKTNTLKNEKCNVF